MAEGHQQADGSGCCWDLKSPQCQWFYTRSRVECAYEQLTWKKSSDMCLLVDMSNWGLFPLYLLGQLDIRNLGKSKMISLNSLSLQFYTRHLYMTIWGLPFGFLVTVQQNYKISLCKNIYLVKSTCTTNKSRQPQTHFHHSRYFFLIWWGIQISKLCMTNRTHTRHGGNFAGSPCHLDHHLLQQCISSLCVWTSELPAACFTLKI